MSTKTLSPQDDPNMVWDVFENTWVTREYWSWVNGRVPAVRTEGE